MPQLKTVVLLATFGLGAILVASEIRAAEPIRVTDDFESGQLGRWRVEDATRLVVNLPLEQDESQINSAISWFYGRLDGVLHREVTIDFAGLQRTVYNGKPVELHPFERGTRPVFSYDGQTWHRFTDCVFDLEQKRFRIRQIFSQDTVWFAYMVPYTLSRLESVLAEFAGHPALRVTEFGRSVQGRPLYLLTVCEPAVEKAAPESATSTSTRPSVWIAARQHAFEAGGSWAVEGLLRFLLSTDTEAARIRSQFTLQVLPMLNPDGVVLGKTRFNAAGVDLNRHWHPTDPLSGDRGRAPEIALVKSLLADWSTNHRLDLWINIHNNDMVWNEDGDYIRFAPAHREAEARVLERLLRESTVFTGPFLPAAGAEATEAVVAAETGALGLLMEMKTGYLEILDRWTGVDLFLAHGPGVVRAASAWLQAQPAR